jgi:hypothetical protein
MRRVAFCFLATLLAFLHRFAAGQEESKTKLDLKTLTGLLGKNRDSPEVKRFQEMVGEKAEESEFESGKFFFYSWKSKGLSLSFVSGKLEVVFMYAEGADGFKQYQGELPAKLSFTDTRSEVEKKLGKPEVSGGDGVIPFWVVYPSEGVLVGYVSKDTKDQKNRIHHLGLRSPRKKAKGGEKGSGVDSR